MSTLFFLPDLAGSTCEILFGFILHDLKRKDTAMLNELNIFAKKLSAAITTIAQETIDAGEEFVEAGKPYVKKAIDEANKKYQEGFVAASKKTQSFASKMQAKASEYQKELKTKK